MVTSGNTAVGIIWNYSISLSKSWKINKDYRIYSRLLTNNDNFHSFNSNVPGMAAMLNFSSNVFVQTAHG